MCLQRMKVMETRRKTLSSVKGAVQLKSWLAEEVHVCPECRARTLLGKGQMKLLHVSRDLKIQLCMECCGKDVLKSWSVKIRMDVVTLLMGLEWGLLCCALLIRMQDQDALKPAGLDQNKTSSIFRGKSYSVSDTPETARGEPEGDKIAVFLWPVSSAGLQGCRLGPFAWAFLLVSLCKCHRAVIRTRSESCSNRVFFHMQCEMLTESKCTCIFLDGVSFHSAMTGAGEVLEGHREE